MFDVHSCFPLRNHLIQIEGEPSQVSAPRRPCRLCGLHPFAFCLDGIHGSVGEDFWTR
jgi:hypothetical protein